MSLKKETETDIQAHTHTHIYSDMLTVSDGGCHSVDTALHECRRSPAFMSSGRPSSSPRSPSPQALTLLEGARFIAWLLGRPFFRGMPTRPVAFLDPSGVSGQQSCARNNLKKDFVPHSSGRWDVRQIDTYILRHLLIYTHIYTYAIRSLFFYEDGFGIK